jgi:hypothetical protein
VLQTSSGGAGVRGMTHLATDFAVTGQLETLDTERPTAARGGVDVKKGLGNITITPGLCTNINFVLFC